MSLRYCTICLVDIPSDHDHLFCGYGYMNQYCESCCPKVLDGQTCDKCQQIKLKQLERTGFELAKDSL